MDYQVSTPPFDVQVKKKQKTLSSQSDTNKGLFAVNIVSFTWEMDLDNNLSGD